MSVNHPYSPKGTISTKKGDYTIYRLEALKEQGVGHVDKLPYSIRVLLESCLRNYDGEVVTKEHIDSLANYDAKNVGEQEIAFNPGRVVLQDFTGVPAVVDLAALRSAMHAMGGDTNRVNPENRADLVIDHSVQVDAFGNAQALSINKEKEFSRNKERYEFLKWGQKSFSNFSVVPPETGIVHQVNLEYLAAAVLEKKIAGENVAYPDSLVGTDSHTTMINGLGVTGWGVGGIEAEAGMLGQPVYMLIPKVVGFRLTGNLKEGATATDLVLMVTQMLRAHGVVGKFVEFYGPGLDHLSLADRATIANMAPEYGATMGFFPIDDKTVEYLEFSGRSDEQVDLVRTYCKANMLWRDDEKYDGIVYSSNLELDLGDVVPALAGPTRPQDRILLSDMKTQFNKDRVERFGKKEITAHRTTYRGETFDLKDGAVVIAAITSCTNTSNPAVMIGAGIVAKKAAALGLKAKPWVKTSLAPGSRVVTDYLERAGLLDALDQVGFYTVGYGCTTCIGNSGPLGDEIIEAVNAETLVVASVLSGNRNFEGRISPQTKVNYLASPPLVVAYAIAGTVNIELQKDPIGVDKDGNDVFLRDIWPTNQEVQDLIKSAVTREQFEQRYSAVSLGPKEWQALDAEQSEVYNWKPESTYIQHPPFFQGMTPETPVIKPTKGAHVLGIFGDSTTTDHISPAGAIPPSGPAGKYLLAHGIEPRMFNSFGSRRGNDQVMTRGTFANIRIKNLMIPGTEGGVTKYLGPDEQPANPRKLNYESDVDPKHGEITSIYDASVKYQRHGIPLIVFGGIDYGMGSSRDWAAKGTYLLGVTAVVTQSYERIHRSNLIGMGVLPLQFKEGENVKTLGITGEETFDVHVDDTLKPLQDVKITAHRPDGTSFEFTVLCRIDTPVEVKYYRNGGILHYVLRRMVNESLAEKAS